MTCLPRTFYQRSTELVARDLIGKRLVRILRKGSRTVRLSGTIIETEGYGHKDDLASHACRGMTVRNQVMFGEAGKTYVYFTYGNHFCVNLSARSKNVDAGAVLIRSLEPVEGVEIMRKFRPVDNLLSLTSGPGKLTQALDIKNSLNGIDVTSSQSEIHVVHGVEPRQVIATKRIGITQDTEKLWRFLDPTSLYVSRKFRSSHYDRIVS